MLKKILCVALFFAVGCNKAKTNASSVKIDGSENHSAVEVFQGINFGVGPFAPKIKTLWQIAGVENRNLSREDKLKTQVAADFFTGRMDKKFLDEYKAAMDSSDHNRIRAAIEQGNKLLDQESTNVAVTLYNRNLESMSLAGRPAFPRIDCTRAECLPPEILETPVRVAKTSCEAGEMRECVVLGPSCTCITMPVKDIDHARLSEGIMVMKQHQFGRALQQDIDIGRLRNFTVGSNFDISLLKDKVVGEIAEFNRFREGPINGIPAIRE